MEQTADPVRGPEVQLAQGPPEEKRTVQRESVAPAQSC